MQPIRIRELSKKGTRELGVLQGIEDYLDEGQDSLKVKSNKWAYENVSLVTQCINLTSHFTTRKGFTIQTTGPDEQISKMITERLVKLDRKVNLNNQLYLAVINMEVHGRAAFEIVRDDNEKIVMLLPLTSEAVVPVKDETTQEIEYYQYSQAKGGRLELDEVLYLPRNPIDKDCKGQSAIKPIKKTLELKLNLERDLLESSKRLWGPMGLFEMDTSDIRDPEKKRARLKAFANELKPGRSIVHNRSVKGEIVTLSPDINALVRAIEKAEEEIMGNWNMPKALLSREKTITKATLAEAMKGLYEGPIAGIQRFLAREVERQFYDLIVKEMGYDPEAYMPHHLWNPVTILDANAVRSLAYAVRVGAMTKEEFFHVMGWEQLDTGVQPDVVQPPTKPEDIVQEEREWEELKQIAEEVPDWAESEVNR